MKSKHRCALALAACLLAGTAQAGSTRFCDRSQALGVNEQDRLLRFSAIVRAELGAIDDGVALISRSGLDLSRFNIRYSHSALAWRGDTGAWSARQLYYACDESRPRIFDQGLAGFAMGTDDPAQGYVSIVRLPKQAVPALHAAVRDNPRVLHLLAGKYSANAYAFSLAYQNCNQWLIEVMAAAWGDLEDGEDLRARAQAWLRGANYAPEPIDVGSRLLMWASLFVPLLNLDDHPEADRASMQLQVSLPTTIESFVRQRLPGSERIELCHDGKQVVIHRGWTPIAPACRPGDGDRVLAL